MFNNRNTVIISTLLITLILSFGQTNLSASSIKKEIQDRESIRQAAKKFAHQLAYEQGGHPMIHIEVGKIDRRLRLTKCSKPLSAFKSPNTKNAGRTTIGVRCEGDHYWKLYIPVNIQVMKKIAVINQPVTRNSILTSDDIAFVKKDIANLHSGYYTSLKAIIGKHAKRSMKLGTIITPSKIKNPLAIKKGSLITILADIGGIKVRMKGKALKSGALGDWISARNLSSNRKIEGKIMKDGVIMVTL